MERNEQKYRKREKKTVGCFSPLYFTIYTFTFKGSSESPRILIIIITIFIRWTLPAWLSDILLSWSSLPQCHFEQLIVMMKLALQKSNITTEDEVNPSNASQR